MDHIIRNVVWLFFFNEHLELLLGKHLDSALLAVGKIRFLVFCNYEGFAHLHLEEKEFCSSVIKYKVYMSSLSESSCTSHSSFLDRIKPIY